MCKLKDLLRTDMGDYLKHVREPKFVCKSCGRVASEKKMICKPLKIKR